MKNFCSSKDIIKKVKSDPQSERRYMQYIPTDKELISRLYEEVI